MREYVWATVGFMIFCLIGNVTFVEASLPARIIAICVFLTFITWGIYTLGHTN